MNPTSPILLSDRTTIETDWTCPRKRFWYKNYHNCGIIPAEEAKYYEQGRQVHQAMADIVSGQSWEKVCEELSELYPPVGNEDQLEVEPLTWLIGMVGAFGKYIWPYWSQSYEPVLVEKELVLARDPLWLACTADLVLRHKTTKRLVVWDYKSVKLLGKSWMDHWPYAIQLHINIKAVEEELGEPVEKAFIMGLKKGEDRDGKLRHPYVWAYSDGQNKWSPDYNPKMTLRPVWEYPEGVIGWMEHLGEGEAFSLFPTSAPIFLDNRLLDDMIQSRIAREEAISAILPQALQTDPWIRNVVFPQSFSQCRPSFGDKCPYLAVCHNAEIQDDPIGSGLYVYRTPHHEMERLTGHE